MPESFGARLRQRREKQEIALATIAEQTKIKVSLLEELERDDISHWPTGIFRRAFVRAYAAAIHMDQEVAVREFLELFPEPVETPEALPDENGHGHAAPVSGPPTRFRYLVGSLLARLRGEDVETPASESIARSIPPAAPALKARISQHVVESELASASLWEPAPAPTVEAAPSPSLEPTPLARPAVSLEAAPGLDLQLAARICTDFSRLEQIGQVAPMLEDSAKLLRAVGLIVWIWEASTSELMPIFTQGYSDYVLALIPKVKRESDNATAAAFRTAQTTVVASTEHASGAIVVPLLSPRGCIGALAIELKDGAERQQPVRALANFMAAELTRLIDAARLIEPANRRFA
jgi:transcriptional regulator with XRE-family HTH domain